MKCFTRLRKCELCGDRAYKVEEQYYGEKFILCKSCSDSDFLEGKLTSQSFLRSKNPLWERVR